MTDNNRMPADKHSRKKLVMLYTSIIMLLFFAVIFGSTAIFLLYSDKGIIPARPLSPVIRHWACT